ncbi:MAG TPA: hypothetical protein EYN06_04040 [Myxococcales bacterium]|nr:hypothetical protein [Myxococcales bacterium]HIN85631.1 hypothetical protein [Myxococcales bacterium]
MGLRSRLKKGLKELLDAAQKRESTGGSFNVRSTDAVSSPLVARGTAQIAVTEAPSAPPVERTVVRAPVIVAEEVVSDDGTIRIKAQPQRDGESCLFMLNRTLLDEISWHFDSSEAAESSPVMHRLMSEFNLDSVTVDGSTLVIAVEADAQTDWESVAQNTGAILREALASGETLVDSALTVQIPDQETIRTQIQQCIDDEVNPGVAAHSGHITLTAVRGNSVTIQMGGGCQGCSAADLTLKQGIHQSFRTAAPFVGAIYDDTDHGAGKNPYFS